MLPNLNKLTITSGGNEIFAFNSGKLMKEYPLR